MKGHRLARVNSVIREVASETILFELKDPRVKMVTVTRAEVSADLQVAKVYVSVMGTDKERELTLHGLRSAAGFVQSRLADRMKSRFTPVIRFVLDEGVRNSIEVSRLISEALAESAGAKGGQAPPPEGDPADGEPEGEEPPAVGEAGESRGEGAGTDPAPGA